MLFPLAKFSFYEDKPSLKAIVTISELKETITSKGDFFVLKKGDTYEVLDAHCPHMGCIVRFHKDSNRFICPCHNSQFDSNGVLLRGPSTKNLSSLPFTPEHTILKIG